MVRFDGCVSQMRWGPIPGPDKAGVTWLDGIKTMCACFVDLPRCPCFGFGSCIAFSGGSGDPALKEGIAMHVYSCNASMGKTVFYNSDGDYLIGEGS
jgi:homogentisate 1,2-dioxygenase